MTKNINRRESEQDNKNEIKVESHQENCLWMGFKSEIAMTLTKGFCGGCVKVQEQMWKLWNLLLWNIKFIVSYIDFVQNKNIPANYKDIRSKPRLIFLICQCSWLTHGGWRQTAIWCLSVMSGYVSSAFSLSPIQAIEFAISITETFLDWRLGPDFKEVLLRRA